MRPSTHPPNDPNKTKKKQHMHACTYLIKQTPHYTATFTIKQALSLSHTHENKELHDHTIVHACTKHTDVHSQSHTHARTHARAHSDIHARLIKHIFVQAYKSPQYKEDRGKWTVRSNQKRRHPLHRPHKQLVNALPLHRGQDVESTDNLIQILHFLGLQGGSAQCDMRSARTLNCQLPREPYLAGWEWKEVSWGENKEAFYET